MIGVTHATHIHRDWVILIAKSRRNKVPPMRVGIVPVDE